MEGSFSKKVIATFIIALLFGIGIFLFLILKKKTPTEVVPEQVQKLVSVHKVLGKSVQGRSIDAYYYGEGETTIAFVGGVHGGYEWNTVLVAYQIMDYLEQNIESLPKNLSIVVIPSANPDGLYKVIQKEGRFSASDIKNGVATQPGRFNANQVDLNRNFDCKWQPKSVWQNKTVSAGSKPFSEPESVVLKNFVEQAKPQTVVFWHSQGGEVYASQCTDGIIPETLEIMKAYSKASGYPANPTYDAYETTGDADSWLARIGIPAITVELKTHDSTEYEQNLAGVKAVIEYYKINEKKK